jgi:hypothetical protein
VYTLCWSAKGGCGTTVVASALAVLSARSAPTTLIDLGGDVPAALGMAEPGEPGVGDWLAAGRARPEALWNLAVDASEALRVVPLGTPPVAGHLAWERLADACAVAPGAVVIDAGSLLPPPIAHRSAAQSLIITRPCYLALRRAARCTGLATGSVLVREPSRALSAIDAAHAIGAPVVAELVWDPAVARAVDSGMLAARLPLSLVRPLQRLVAAGAAA